MSAAPRSSCTAVSPTREPSSTPVVLADLKQLWALVPVLIAVTGRVLAPKPYACEMSETEAAIVEVRPGTAPC